MTSEAINEAYQDVLGRDADESGMDAYSRHVNTGAITLEQLPDILRASDEYSENTGRYYVDPSAAMRGDQGASEVIGKLQRAQWGDWKNRFAPQIDKLANMATDTTLPGQSAAQAMTAVEHSFGGARTALQMQQQGLGIQLDSTQRASQGRKFALSEAATKANAANKARTSTQDLQQSVLAGDMGSKALPITALQNQ